MGEKLHNHTVMTGNVLNVHLYCTVYFLGCQPPHTSHAPSASTEHVYHVCHQLPALRRPVKCNQDFYFPLPDPMPIDQVRTESSHKLLKYLRNTDYDAKRSSWRRTNHESETTIECGFLAAWIYGHLKGHKSQVWATEKGGSRV